jgi:signal transduction histidine kinase
VDVGSLRTRLLALVLLLIVPAFLLLLASNLKRQDSEKALARERAITTAKLAAVNESFYVRQTRHQLATMTQFPFALMRDRALTEKGLKSLKRLQADYEDFGLVEMDGTVFCHTLGSNVTETFNPSLLRKVVEVRGFSQSVFHRDPLQKQPMLQFGYPVIGTNGTIARMMYASLKSHLIPDALTNVSLPKGGEVMVFDGEGNVLARHPDLGQWVGRRLPGHPFIQTSRIQQEGIFEAAGLDGVHRVFAVSRVGDNNQPFLFVTVGVPRQAVFAAADREFIGNSLLMALLVAFLSGLAWWYSDRFFVRPASAIVAAADRISEGDLRARTGLPRGKSELQRLAERFDQMAARLERRQSELEQANSEIKSHNKQLEERVAERTQALQLANRELEAFSYSVSHDLRAPLRHMDGFAQMLLKNPKVREDPGAQRQVGVITSAAKQMGKLIDDLLSFSFMGRKALTNGEVNFSEVVQDVIAEAVTREPERKMEWHVEPLPVVLGDAALLRQVWINLISNAVKYTRGRTPAIITISCRDSGAETIFSVRDNGAGFDMAYAGKLFGVFQRLHRAEEFEGTGIGLANVRRIVTRHGGRAWAEGKLGMGAIFSFSLPNISRASEDPRHQNNLHG